jgi:hypothetical protein
MKASEGLSPQQTKNTQPELGDDLGKRAGIGARRIVDAVIDVATSRRTIAAGAALTAAVALAGSQPRPSSEHKSQSAVPADISYQNFGKNGNPAPRLIPSQSHDPITQKIEVVPSNDPEVLAAQAVWLAAHPESYGNKLSMLSVWGGYIEITNGTLYHWLKGSKTFTPANPSNDGEAGKITATPDNPVWIKYPTIWTGYVGTPDEPSFVMATMENGPADVRKIENVYFWSIGSAGAKFYASNRFYNQRLGLAAPPSGGIATINDKGELDDGTGEQFSVVLSKPLSAADIQQQGLVEAQAP